MAKAKTIYFCNNCGHQSGKWIGKCPSCGEWNTFEEEVISKPSAKDAGNIHKIKSVPTAIQDITSDKEKRIPLIQHARDFFKEIREFMASTDFTLT